MDVQFRRTTLLTVVSLAFLVGVILAPNGGISLSWLTICLLLLPVLFRRKLPALLLCIVLGIVVGQLRGQAQLRSEAPLSVLMGQKVELKATVSEDAYYDAKKRLVSVLHTNAVFSPYVAGVSAPLRVSTFSVTDLKRGDIVNVRGKLTPTLGNYVGSINYADIEIVGREANWFNTLRRRFESGLRNALPEPQASFAAGLLIGQRSGLPVVWQDILRDAGLMHIIAVSGYNLTIIIAFSRRLLRRGSRYQILLAGLLLTTSFIAITGLSPSIMRAAVVAFFLQLGWFFGKQFRPLLLILFSAAITAWVDPSQLWRSVGWYLSFAAFFGIIMLAPLFTNKMRPTMSSTLEVENNPLGALVAESVSAFIMTAPIMIVVFGRVSTVALLTNIIVAPLIPLAMLFSLIAGLAGMWVPVISSLIGLPARLVLTFILDIANVAARIPGAAIEVKFSWHAAVVMYGGIAVVCGSIYLARRRHNRGQIDRDMVELPAN